MEAAIVCLEARQETDTKMDKTPKGWWMDGWLDVIGQVEI